MRRVRGFLAGYLGLVALSAVLSEGGSQRASGLLGTLGTLVERALSPGVAGIRDFRRGGSGGKADKPSGTGPNPDAPPGGSSTVLGTRPTLDLSGN